MKIERYNIGKLGISNIDLPKAVDVINESIQMKIFSYVCVTNARTCYVANRDDEYRLIQNNSLLTVPDGMPLVWIAHSQGYENVGRVSGPDLLDSVLKISTGKKYSHYFYGSTEKTIAGLQENIMRKYPTIEIKKAYSPPFQKLSEFDIDGLAKEINLLKPTFFWCGLGAPKQERLVALLQPKLEQTICIGIGLAFEYIAGTVKRAPLWMQKSGLEWAYRLAQQPKNIKRGIYPLSWILKQVIISHLNKRTRKKVKLQNTS